MISVLRVRAETTGGKVCEGRKWIARIRLSRRLQWQQGLRRLSAEQRRGSRERRSNLAATPLAEVEVPSTMEQDRGVVHHWAITRVAASRDLQASQPLPWLAGAAPASVGSGVTPEMDLDSRSWFKDDGTER